MKKFFAFFLFIAFTMGVVFYSLDGSSYPASPEDIDIKGAMIVTEDNLKIPLDSVLKYFRALDTSLVSRSGGSKGPIAIDLDPPEELLAKTRLKEAIQDYLRADSTRRANTAD